MLKTNNLRFGLCSRYGAAYKAIVIVPLVSAFLIDIANAVMINFFLFLKT
jgi:sodium--glutamate symport carrier gltS